MQEIKMAMSFIMPLNFPCFFTYWITFINWQQLCLTWQTTRFFRHQRSHFWNLSRNVENKEQPTEMAPLLNKTDILPFQKKNGNATSLIIEERNNSKPPTCPIHWMWGGRMTNCVAVPVWQEKNRQMSIKVAQKWFQ